MWALTLFFFSRITGTLIFLSLNVKRSSNIRQFHKANSPTVIITNFFHNTEAIFLCISTVYDQGFISCYGNLQLTPEYSFLYLFMLLEPKTSAIQCISNQFVYSHIEWHSVGHRSSSQYIHLLGHTYMYRCLLFYLTQAIRLFKLIYLRSTLFKLIYLRSTNDLY